MKKLEYKTLSKRARLLLDREEDYDVEFKKSLAGLDNEDIIAFANSESGGAILIGVEEATTEDGRQVGTIAGCSIGDREKLSIVNRAESCVPPVDIEVVVENANRKPFYRIEIPSGDKKPYCTSGGKYKIRGDGRTKPLLPGRLLSMFVETESQQFIERFREATRALEHSLGDTKTKIMKEMGALLTYIEGMEIGIERSLEQIFSSAADAQEMSAEAMGFSDETLGMVHQIDGRVESVENTAFGIEAKVDALLKNFDIEDPAITRMRNMVKAFVKDMLLRGLLKADEKDERDKLLETFQRTFPRATEQQLSLWCAEAIEEFNKQNYQDE